MQQFFTVALPLLAMVTTNTATLPQVFPPPPVSGPPPFSIIQEEPTLKTATREVAPVKPKEKRLIYEVDKPYVYIHGIIDRDKDYKDLNNLLIKTTDFHQS